MRWFLKVGIKSILRFEVGNYLSERKFSLYDVEQFLREAGAERVTEDAVLNLERQLEKLAERMAHNAIGYARHAGRKKLIKRSDVLLLRKPQPHHYSSPANLRRKARITNSISRSER
jgi:histone H3/H4